MKKMQILQVQGSEIRVIKVKDEEYISLTDMAKSFGGNDQIKNWIRTRRTVEFLGTWETINNPDFNMVGFHQVSFESGSDRFIMSPTQWAERTNAVGLMAKSGRYGSGTFAHKDIAFEFGTWLSPQFKLYLIKEFQRLKEIESNEYNLEWKVKRILSKANYKIHADAVQKCIVPEKKWIKEALIYADEADILNLALFKTTAKRWKEEYPEQTGQGLNIRDIASINELTVLSNLESLNSVLIKQGKSKEERFMLLEKVADEQLKLLRSEDFLKTLKYTSEDIYLPSDDSDSQSTHEPIGSTTD